MAKEKIHKVSKVEIKQSLPETISSDDFDVLSAIILSDENSVVTIHEDFPEIEAEEFDIKKFIKMKYENTDIANIFSVFDISEKSSVQLSGTINVTNGRKELGIAVHNQYPMLNINVTGDGVVHFKDPEVYRLMQILFAKNTFYRSDFNASKNQSWLENKKVEYFNEYVIFLNTRVVNFTNCVNLKEVTLPSNITSCAPFDGCVSLQKINLDNIVSFNNANFRNCSELVVKSLCDDVASLPYAVFYNCKKLELTTLPKKLKTIGSSVFYGSGIKITEIHNLVNNIENSAFYNCDQLKELTINASIDTIPNLMCYNCINLESVIINSNVKTIGTNAFGNTKLLTLVLPNTLETLNNDCFNGGSIKYLTINFAGLKSIGDGCFKKAKETFTTSVIKIDNNGKKYVDFRNLTLLGTENFYNSAAMDFVCDYAYFGKMSIGNLAMTMRSSALGFCFKNMYFDFSLSEYFEFYLEQASTLYSPLYGLITTNSHFYTKENGEYKEVVGDFIIPQKYTDIKCHFLLCSASGVNRFIAPQAKKLAYISCSTVTSINSPINSNIAYYPNLEENTGGLTVQVTYAYCPKLKRANSGMFGHGYTTRVDIGEDFEYMHSGAFAYRAIWMVLRCHTAPEFPTNFLTYEPERIYVTAEARESYNTIGNWWRYTDRMYIIGGERWRQEFKDKPDPSSEWASYPNGIRPDLDSTLINSFNDI